MSDLIASLAAELKADPDGQYAGKSVEAVTAIINEGYDLVTTPVLTTVDVRIGFGAVLNALGAVEGAQVLDKLEAAASHGPLKWAWRLLEADKLDVGNEQTRQQIDQIQAGGIFTPEQAAKIKAIAERAVEPLGPTRADAPILRVILGLPDAPNTVTVDQVREAMQ